MAALIALHKALYFPGSLALILAPAERQAKETFGKVLSLYRKRGHAIPPDSYRKLGMHLANGSRVEALPGSERTIRGFSGVDLLAVGVVHADGIVAINPEGLSAVDGRG